MFIYTYMYLYIDTYIYIEVKEFGLDSMDELYPLLKVIDSGLGGVPREQEMLQGHLPRVISHQVYQYTKIIQTLVKLQNYLGNP